jgi:hypothetical protein
MPMKQTNISHADSPEEIAHSWDTHSPEDHWDETHEAAFEVRARQRRRITLDPELYGEIEAQARQRRISPETLVNIWLAERVREA